MPSDATPRDGNEYSAESGRRADADRIIDSILGRLDRWDAELPDHSLDWNTEKDREFVRERFDGNVIDDECMPPGFGPDGEAGNARDDCGEDHPFVCPGCGSSTTFGRTCGQSVCTRCGVAWVRDAAIQKTAKVRRLRKEKDYSTHDREHQKLHHVVISPDLAWLHALAKEGKSLDAALDVALEAAKDTLDELRAQGVLIQHSFRGKKPDGSLAADSQMNDMGMWAERLNSNREWYDDVREELAWKPHFHAVVVADKVDIKSNPADDEPGIAERVEEKTGWVIHRIETTNERGQTVSLGTDGDMCRALMYSLSHADIEVNPDKNNQSIVREVGTFEGEAIKSSDRFSPQPHDLDWADNMVRSNCKDLLGFHSGSAECGNRLPAVDEPDELARRVLNDLYPDDDELRRTVATDTVLGHIAEGNIELSSSTGGSISVASAFGMSVDHGLPGSAGDVPDLSSSEVAVDGGEEAVAPVVEIEEEREASEAVGDQEDRDDQEHDHTDGDCHYDDCRCTETMIPLEEARERGFIDDAHWRREAPHASEALDTDDEWPDDMDKWKTVHPGSALGATT